MLAEKQITQPGESGSTVIKGYESECEEEEREKERLLFSKLLEVNADFSANRETHSNDTGKCNHYGNSVWTNWSPKSPFHGYKYRQKGLHNGSLKKIIPRKLSNVEERVKHWNSTKFRGKYICHICGAKNEHFIRNCPKANDRRRQKKVKPATGLPRSWLKKISDDDIAEANGDVYCLPGLKLLVWCEWWSSDVKSILGCEEERSMNVGKNFVYLFFLKLKQLNERKLVVRLDYIWRGPANRNSVFELMFCCVKSMHVLLSNNLNFLDDKFVTTHWIKTIKLNFCKEHDTLSVYVMLCYGVIISLFLFSPFFLSVFLIFCSADGSFAVMRDLACTTSSGDWAYSVRKKIHERFGSSAPAVENALRCGICTHLFQKAVLIPCCGETFCETCILSKLTTENAENRCPSCDATVTPSELCFNRAIQDSVNSVTEIGNVNCSSQRVKKEKKKIYLPANNAQEEGQKDLQGTKLESVGIESVAYVAGATRMGHGPNVARLPSTVQVPRTVKTPDSLQHSIMNLKRFILSSSALSQSTLKTEVQQSLLQSTGKLNGLQKAPGQL